METKVQFTKEGLNNYGPPVLGAILVLLLLFGGYSFWRDRQAQQSQLPDPFEVNELTQDLNKTADLKLTPDTNTAVDPNTPKSNLQGAVTPTPTPASLAQGTTATTTTETKLTVLPKAGFPGLATVAGLIASLFAGFKLSKYKKN